MLLNLIIFSILNLSAILAAGASPAALKEETIIAELDPHYYSSTDNLFDFEVDLKSDGHYKRFHYVQ